MVQNSISVPPSRVKTFHKHARKRFITACVQRTVQLVTGQQDILLGSSSGSSKRMSKVGERQVKDHLPIGKWALNKCYDMR